MESENIFLDDVVILGTAVPDVLRDNRRTVCTAGYSDKLGLIRIYPVPIDAHLGRWDIVSVPLERNPADTRVESWKIKGSRSNWDHLKDSITKVGEVISRSRRIELEETLLDRYGVSCVDNLNERKLSLGIIDPIIEGHYLGERKNYDPSIQGSLTHDEPFLTIRNYKEQPRLVYRCPNCVSKKPHDQQILEWGSYEWMRNNKQDYEQLWENFHIDDPDYRKLLLIGNQAKHRNAFMVISIFRRKLPN